MDGSRLNQLSFPTLFVYFAVESPLDAEINIFQSKLGIMVENITSDTRFGFSDVYNQLLTCHFCMTRVQLTGFFINVHCALFAT